MTRPPFGDAFGRGTDWLPCDLTLSETMLHAEIEVPAGGWYRLEVRCVSEDGSHVTAAVEPVGVGELFLIAGQSYAANCNDERLTIDDPQERVTAYSLAEKKWSVAHDPQPGADDGGTIWPPMTNALLPLLRVPIGMVNVAVGATSSGDWLPGGTLHRDLLAAGRDVRRFRAVLWQQGESDVIDRVPADQYVRNLCAIRDAAAAGWQLSPPWFLAKSTLHPMIYNDPEQETVIRQAIEHVSQMPGFLAGPDTDILGGENRGGRGSRHHFSALGQQRAGLMWFATIWSHLNAGTASWMLHDLASTVLVDSEAIQG